MLSYAVMGHALKSTAALPTGNLFMEDDSFEDNEATNGAAVYAVQGCGQVHLHSLCCSAWTLFC